MERASNRRDWGRLAPLAGCLLGCLWIACTPGSQSIEERSSALNRNHRPPEELACCERQFRKGPQVDRCLIEAECHRGPCARKVDAGRDATGAGATDGAGNADAARAMDARADVPAAPDAPADTPVVADARADGMSGADAQTNADAGPGGADTGQPLCAPDHAPCTGSTVCCGGEFCDTSLTQACACPPTFSARPCAPGDSCCGGTTCTSGGRCPAPDCTSFDPAACRPPTGVAAPLTCCSSTSCFPNAPSAFCPCVADGFACNPCCGGAGCVHGTCQPKAMPDAGATPPPNHCPTLRITTAPPITVPVAGTTSVTVEVTDLDPLDPLTQTWSIVSGPATLTTPATAATVTVSCQAAGTVVLQVAGDDGRGSAAIASACPGSIVQLAFGCGPITCLGDACDDSNPCCPGTACQGGVCTTCGGALAGCSAVPCCSGYVCDRLSCSFGAPACMPVGGQCDAVHPCCGGVTCNNGICGSACVATGAACDDLHACCYGDSCVAGQCQITTCVPQGERCIGGQCCLGAAVCAAQGGLCQLPGCALGNCPKKPLGCGLPGSACAFNTDCCTGQCSLAVCR